MHYEPDLETDYNHLESFRCFCGKPKEPGESFCKSCTMMMLVHELQELKAIKPGEGVAVHAGRMYSRLERRRREW